MANVTGIGTGFGLKNFSKEGVLTKEPDNKLDAQGNTSDSSIFNYAGQNKYPIGAIYNGVDGFSSAGTQLPWNWTYCSGLFLETTGYSSFLGNIFTTNYKPYDNLDRFATGSTNVELTGINYSGGKVLKLYGAGDSFIAFNRDPDRTFPDLPVIGATTNDVFLGSGGTLWGDNRTWVKHEYCHFVTIPSNHDKIEFGAFARCDPADFLRQYNMGAIYIVQQNSSAPMTVQVDTIIIKRDDNGYTLASGSLPIDRAIWNFSGLNINYNWTDRYYPTRWNDYPTITHEYHSANDLANFKRLSRTVDRATFSGVTQRIWICCAFLENTSYLPETPPDPNPLSGSVDFYSPFVKSYES